MNNENKPISIDQFLEPSPVIYLITQNGTVAHKGQCNKKWSAAIKRDRMQTKKI